MFVIFIKLTATKWDKYAEKWEEWPIFIAKDKIVCLEQIYNETTMVTLLTGRCYSVRESIRDISIKLGASES